LSVVHYKSPVLPTVKQRALPSTVHAVWSDYLSLLPVIIFCNFSQQATWVKQLITSSPFAPWLQS